MLFLDLVLAFVLFIIHQTTLTSSITNGILHSWCSNNTMFANNSAYQINLNTLLRSLSSNATNNPHGYYRNTVGDPSGEPIYGHYLCRGDQNTSMCHECVNNATTTYLPKTLCPNMKVALIWTDFCMVRYSNVSFFNNMDLNPGIIFSIGVPGDATEFYNVANNTINNIAVRAAEGGPLKKFDVETTNGSIYVKPMYGYGQCTPDLSLFDCHECLISSIGQFLNNTGGQYIVPSCIVRFEDYSYLDPSYLSQSQSPPLQPPPPASAPVNMDHVKRKNQVSSKVLVSIIAPLLVFAVAVFSICTFLLVRKTRKIDAVTNTPTPNHDDFTVESLQYDLATLESATNNFSDENKLGEGGFGAVYKGTLSNGELIAVKRLSASSSQGIQEFKSEVLLVAKLQHRNLVRLLGFCYTRQEKLLVYEHVANKSLDNFLFDHENRRLLNWRTRYNIIRGIARGLLYLHHDTQLRIIHRDLKASNILLDQEMNPKISDFGTSRILGVDNQSQSNYTSRVVGTYGYMSPEYALHGQFSIKSDVYSFGVLVFEIISGKKNSIVNQPDESEGLLCYAWKQWAAGTPVECVDPMIRNSCSNNSEVMRCIHLALLCVQESAESRPTMANVALTLDSNSVTLPLPEQPIFFTRARIESTVSKEVGSDHSSNKSTLFSVNDVSITEFEPR